MKAGAMGRVYLDPARGAGVSGYHDDPEQLNETLSAYLDGALPTKEREALERHLDGCAECQRELAGLARVGVLLRALPEPDLPRSFILPETATHQARAISAGQAPAWTRAAQWAGGLVAAFGLGLLVLGALPNVGPATAGFSLDRHSSSAAGGATSAPAVAPATASATATPDNTQLYAGSPVATGGTPQVTATPTSTPAPTSSATPSSVYGPVNAGQADRGGAGASLEPVGAALLIGGGAALTLGAVRRRRSRRTQDDQS